MPQYHVTQYYSWTFTVTADSEEEAIELAADMELSGEDLIGNLRHFEVVEKREGNTIAASIKKSKP